MGHPGDVPCLLGTESSSMKALHLSLDDPTFVPEYPALKYYINETESVTLRCRIKSFPKPTVWWEIPLGITVGGRFQYQTTLIEDTPEYSIVERSLTISSAEIIDYGIYTCSGNNTFKNITKDSKLCVYCKFLFSCFNLVCK